MSNGRSRGPRPVIEAVQISRYRNRFCLSVKIGGAWLDAAEVAADADKATQILNLEDLRDMIKPMEPVKSDYGVLLWKPKA